MLERLRARRRRRRLERFHAQCDRLRIPEEARARMLKAGVDSAPDWYAGRQRAQRVEFF